VQPDYQFPLWTRESRVNIFHNVLTCLTVASLVSRSPITEFIWPQDTRKCQTRGSHRT
jgi:hypothetical protein